MQDKLGVALDIGTTTIQGKLINLNERKELSYFSCLNEQLTLGHDIISRIKLCLEKPNGLEKLHKKIISSINFVIRNLVSNSNKDRNDISLIAAVGNAALYHFVLSLSPKKLAEVPYQPEHKALAKKSAEELGIEAHRTCEFNFLPNIGGFVGSDAIAVLLATDMDKSKSPILAVDIGTNGEIILGSKERIRVASTAAGPAFEGWHVSCGMRAVEGAIESVEDTGGKLSLKVIGGGSAEGITGSAIIDIIAILLNRGDMDISGNLKRNFVVVDKPKRISVSGGDVREVQLAKAAFAVGISFLRRLSEKDLTRFFITGKFGNYLNKDNAKRVGIIPQDVDLTKVEFLKDGALKGAEIFINNKKSIIPRINDILAKTEHISLSQDEDFQKEFIAAMKF